MPAHILRRYKLESNNEILNIPATAFAFISLGWSGHLESFIMSDQTLSLP